MRTLTSATSTKLSAQYAAEPMLILEIQWTGGTEYYAGRTTTIGGTYNLLGILLQVGQIETTVADSISESATVDITLDDCDGLMKSKADSNIIEGLRAKLYQYFVGTAWTDKITLIDGRVIGPVTWSEGLRQLNFSLESTVISHNTHAKVNRTQYQYVADAAVDRPWPMCFGTVLNVPALQIVKNSDLCHTTSDIEEDSTTFTVNDSTLFPQSTSITVSIGRVLFTGSFSGNTFTITDINATYYTNIDTIARPTTDPDYYNPKVIWISNTPKIRDLTDRILKMSDGRGQYHVAKQVGNKLWLDLDMLEANPPLLPLRDSDVYDLLGEEENAIAEVLGRIDAEFVWLRYIINYWTIKEGQTVSKRDTELPPDTYIINHAGNVTSTTSVTNELLQVMGTRKIKNDDQLVPIPSSYYTYTALDSINGVPCSTLTFATPLQDYEDEGWTGDVYVSLRSAIGNNVIDQLTYILEHFTNIAVDSTTFNGIKTELAYYPANYALLEDWDAKELCKEVAYQSRCALVFRNAIAYIKYLSAIPTADYTFTTSDIVIKSLESSSTTFEDLITNYTAKWRKDYYNAECQIVYSNNISTLGSHEGEYEFFIYNNENLVRMSAYFWGYRLSNVWRQASFTALLNLLKLETFDCGALNIGSVILNTVRGQTTAVSYDLTELEVPIRLWLACKAGTQTEDTNFWTGDPACPVAHITVPDPGANLHTIDYDVEPDIAGSTSTSSTYDPGKKYIRITAPTAAEIERETNFTITVQLQDAAGAVISESIDLELTLISADSADTFDDPVSTTDTITLTAGEYSATYQILTGTTEARGLLVCSEPKGFPDYIIGYSGEFTIIPKE